MKLPIRSIALAATILTCYYAGSAAFAQGVMLRGSGAVNEAVGGTATAMPLDASGALLWNPATISALPKNEISLGLGLIQAESKVTTSGHNSDNGSTKGEAGVVPVPSMGFVWSTSRRSPFTYGIGLTAVGGAASLYPHDSGNAVLAQHGRSADVVILQMTPTASVQLTRRMSVGVAPIIDLASLNLNPMSLGRPATDKGALTTYGTRYVWGGGFQVGTYYDFQNHFKAGFMFKSPIWAEKLYFTGIDGEDNAASAHFQLNLPMTLSAGISYDGFRDTVIGMDVRYLDYGNTTGFKTGVGSTGRVDGLDWESVFSINVGLERKINSRLKGRMGYCWNENPIPGRSAYMSIAAPMMTQHVVSFGFGYTFARDLEMSAAFCHAFESKVSGDIPDGSGGSAGIVTNTMYANTLMAGLTKRW